MTDTYQHSVSLAIKASKEGPNRTSLPRYLTLQGDGMPEEGQTTTTYMATSLGLKGGSLPLKARDIAFSITS